MNSFIDYFNFVASRIVSILDSLRIGNSPSLLYFILASIIIGLILRIIKGGSTEFERNTNFFNSRIVLSGIDKYNMSHKSRKASLVNNSSSTIPLEEMAKFRQSAALSLKKLNDRIESDIAITDSLPIKDRVAIYRKNGLSDDTIRSIFKEDNIDW